MQPHDIRDYTLFDNMGASGMPHLPGIYRYKDYLQGAVNHALHTSLAGAALDINLTHVWPASRIDAGAAQTYKGWVPMGSLLAIPHHALDANGNQTGAAITMPGGLPLWEQYMFTALQNYGAYVHDLGGAIEGEARLSAAGVIGGLIVGTSIFGLMRRVTNNTTDGTNNNPLRPLGGPGVRRAPYLSVI